MLTAKWTTSQCTITLDSNGSSVVDSITADYCSALTAPDDPTREGYTFVGWDPTFPATMPANGVSLTAQWTVNQYTITFNSNGGSEVTAITADYGTPLTLPSAPDKEGYYFLGWFDAADPWAMAPTTMPAGDMTLTAFWDPYPFAIYFNSDGGSEVSEIWADCGSALTAPDDPTREGYTFVGWDPTFPATMPANGVSLTAQWTVNQYTITFNSNGGSEVTAITADYGTPLTLPSAPDKEGYYFLGWFDAADPWAMAPTTMPAGDMTLTAFWDPYPFAIYFNSDGGSEVSEIWADCGSALTAPDDPTREGYTFVGWDPTFPATMPANGVSLTAQWTVNQYTITFNSNGGSEVTAITADYGTPLTLPSAPDKEGYYFLGWFDAADPWAMAPTTMPAGDMTLTAFWDPYPFAIYFNSDGGSEVSEIWADCGSALTAPDDPTREGYTFVGWDPTFPATMPANGVSLTAQWTVNQYTITFNSNGGSEVTAITAAEGSSLTVPTDPIKEGHAFAGWDPAFPATMPALGAKLTARWNVNQYTITFDSAGGSNVKAISADYGATLTAPTNPTKDGFTFAGWNPAFPATMPLGGATLTAQWSARQYTISFNSNGGSAVAPISAADGATLTAPADPTREGYTFAGWNPAFPAKMPTGGLTLTAKWNVNRYTITFDSAGGSKVTTITADYGTKLYAPANPTRTGYTFAGWNPAFPAKMPAGGLALTAQWTANNFAYSIVYYYNGIKDASKTEAGSAAFGSAISSYPDKNIAKYKLDHDTAPLTISANPTANVLSVYYVRDTAQWPVKPVEKIALATENGFTLVYKGETVRLDRDDHACGCRESGPDLEVVQHMARDG